jgi:CheY-like chemotaxis protein
VVAVGSGEEALTALGRGPCGLVILDIQMPGRDGFEVLRLFRFKVNDPPKS